MKRSNTLLGTKIAYSAAMSAVAIFLGSATAFGSTTFLPAESAITVIRDDAKVTKFGLNQFYPIQYRVDSSIGADFADYSVTNGDSSFNLTEYQSQVVVDGHIDFTLPTTIAQKSDASAQPVPVLVKSPLDLGRVTFAYNSFELSDGAKSIIALMANEIAQSNLQGIYLVGNADRTGSQLANAKISLKRAKAVRAQLLAELSELGFTKFNVKIENMADILASGPIGKKSEVNRNVTFMLYPIVKSQSF